MRILRTLSALSVVVLAALGCAQAVPAKTGLRAMAYNIEWFSEEASPERIANLKSVINNVKPDVVGLEEIQSKKALEQVFDSSWEIGIKDEASEDQETAIAVRKPLRLVEYDLVFKDASFDFAFPGKRDVLRAVVATPGGKSITFYVLHMKSRSGGRLQTDPQREFGAGLLAAYIKGKREENVVVLGDLNDAPDDASVNILESGNLMAKAGREQAATPLLVNLTEPLYRADYVSFGLNEMFQGQPLQPVIKDAWSENERTRGINYRYPQDLKVTQVFFDQFLVSPALAKVATRPNVYTGIDALRGKKGRTRRTDTGTTYTEKGSLASDHLPVYVDLKLD
jgi:endonuclease/exonuclease/phosphatase family metal-dependent hydrolase